MRLFALLILGLVFHFGVKAQVVRIDGPTDQIYTDQLQNLYTVHGDVIRKYLPDGQLQYEISPKRYGKLTFADFNDPLRPLLFYREQGLIQILDNTLSEQGDAIDLFRYFPEQIWLACQSIDNHFWFFSTDNFELIRTDRGIRSVARSGNLIQIVGKAVMPVWMIERNSMLYVADKELGILVFDIYGTYVKTLPVLDVDRFQVYKGQVIYTRNGELCWYDPMSFETSCSPLPQKARLALVAKDRMYLQTEGEVILQNR